MCRGSTSLILNCAVVLGETIKDMLVLDAIIVLTNFILTKTTIGQKVLTFLGKDTNITKEDINIFYKFILVITATIKANYIIFNMTMKYINDPRLILFICVFILVNIIISIFAYKFIKIRNLNE